MTTPLQRPCLEKFVCQTPVVPQRPAFLPDNQVARLAVDSCYESAAVRPHQVRGLFTGHRGELAREGNLLASQKVGIRRRLAHAAHSSAAYHLRRIIFSSCPFFRSKRRVAPGTLADRSLQTAPASTGRPPCSGAWESCGW